MAVHSTNTSIPSGLRAGIDSFLTSFRQGFNAYVTSRARLNELQRLHDKTDEELAQMGLKREDIARHVFRDLFFA